MAIFRRDDPPAESPASRTVAPSRTEPAATTTRVAPGSRFEGKLRGSTDVVVDGELAGEVELGASLTVGAGGRVEASVRARSVRVGGELEGNVVVDERLEVLAGGRLEGDVRAPRVAIAEGGFFRGHIDMGGEGSAAARVKAGAGKTMEPVAAQAAAAGSEEGR